MPNRQGRRRTASRGRRDAAIVRPDVSSTPQRAPESIPLPSNGARASGALIAVITGALAATMIVQGVDDGGSEAIVRIVIGALLVGLAVIVAALSLVPRQIARWVRGRSGQS